jgi:hypothetical protein
MLVIPSEMKKKKKNRITFYPKLPDFRKGNAMFQGSQASSACLSDTSSIRMSEQHCWNNFDKQVF